MKILAIDVQYYENEAQISGVIFSDFKTNNIDEIITFKTGKMESYIPGQFYKRERPIILELLNKIDYRIDYIIIDGYVFLGKEKKPGLGKYLYDSIQKLDNKFLSDCSIIGVAKNRFIDTPKSCEIFRGVSKKPLYVTSVGLSLDDAKEKILSMYGKYRIPFILKRVDQACRGIEFT